MKKFLAFFAFVLFFVGCGSENSQTKTETKAEQKQVIRLGLSADYPPFEFMDKSNNITGFDVELFNAISKKIGIDVTLHNISFDGLIPALKAGKIDAIMSSMSATAERRASVDFTDPYYATENLFIRKKGTDINETKLSGKAIGVQLGTVQEATANKIEGAKAVPSDSPLTAILALKANKVDLVIVDSSLGYGYLKQNDDLEPFYIEPDGSEGFSIAFDKGKNTELIAKINVALKELKSDGTFENLLKKYDLK
ncbi:transporter substrate-binding domain-containing protein [Campylobacter gastrosuis]|uniref:Transporter substrate-binding domain-containing protein n=1 Tax=Campylobacter gastrosuis TaxID=2974576 RepID=A0ABT7HQU0_9BACT|nr:transporter substrate-binding domain-containing protein [Campylobacter gastrosuis]MDL0089230.1 transporter substrate-binding domain-containing protein [Campylobacter gastrosuis]